MLENKHVKSILYFQAYFNLLLYSMGLASEFCEKHILNFDF